MADALLIERGVLGNGETYEITRSQPYDAEHLYMYTLHYADGEVELFQTMVRAQHFIDGYAKGKETFIKTRDRVNC